MLGVGEFVATAWRPNLHAVAFTEVVPSNYGTAGSQSDLRRRRTDFILSPPDPRIPLFNGLLTVLWRRRVVDTAKVAAVASRAPQTLGLPVTFTTPPTASLSR